MDTLPQRRTFAFVDASNLFYGGEKSLGWKIDYQKLHEYLKRKYDVSRLYYFGGVEIHDFEFDYLLNDCVSISTLARYLEDLLCEKALLTDASNDVDALKRHIKRVNFFDKLEAFGYLLMLKPVKIYKDSGGSVTRKANCDVDMTLMMAANMGSYDRALVLSGDGDFLPVLKFLRKNEKEVLVLSRSSRTAKELKQFAGGAFLDFARLRRAIAREEEKHSEIEQAAPTKDTAQV